MTLLSPSQRSLARHRLEPSPAFEMRLGISQMLDVDSQQTLQDDLKEHASPWERLKIHGNDITNQIPELPGLYMFVWCSEISIAMAQGPDRHLHQILYIGQAGGAGNLGNTLKQRYKDYRKYLRGDPESLWASTEPTNRNGKLIHYLSLRPLEYWYAVVKSREAIPNLEHRMIDLYNPPLNLQLRPKLRARFAPPKPAFGS